MFQLFSLQEFPPKSKLDPKVYGSQDSTITKEQIEDKLDGLTVDQVTNETICFSRQTCDLHGASSRVAYAIQQLIQFMYKNS